MIKNFEQFILECYNPINEAFQSSKLREIIKQHGKPKDKWNIGQLYDIKDDNIVDVVDNSDEYYDKYKKGKEYEERNAYSSIPLEDGSVIVITGSINSYSKYKERHKGNLGKHGGDNIHHKHVNNVNKIESKRFAKKLQPHTSEIVDIIDKILDNAWDLKTDGKYVNKNKIDGKDYEIVCKCDGDSGWLETKIELDGNIYPISISLNVEMSNYRRTAGAEYYNLDVYLNGFEIYNNDFDDDIYITNDDLDITQDTHDNLFSNGYLLSEDEEGEIYDEYARNGLRREDFH
jgi:hypothetical protein